MGIIGNKLNEKIQRNSLQQFDDTTATILDYDVVLNTAKIRFLNPNGEGYLYRDNVEVANTLGGVTGAGIYPGQTCTITFMKNNVFNPVITGLNTNYYSKKTCSDQGAYIVDNYVHNVDTSIETTPMIEDWIDYSNQDKYKYCDDIADFTDTDASFEIHEILSKLDKYKLTEQGITNLTTKSTIKLKDNGDIDIFVSNNSGIRISPQNHSIEIFGTLKVNGQVIDINKIINDK